MKFTKKLFAVLIVVVLSIGVFPADSAQMYQSEYVIESSDPGSGDDVVDGFTVGSIWINESDNTVWRCMDASEGSAVWQDITGGDINQVGDGMSGTVFTQDGNGNQLYFEGTTSNDNEILLQGQNPGEDISLTLPGSEGSSGQILSTDGSGVLSWTDDQDDQNIYGSVLDGTGLTIGIENGSNETVDLSPLDNADSVSDLSDADSSSPSDGEALMYDGTTDNQYENRAITESDISDLGSYLPLSGGTMTGQLVFDDDSAIPPTQWPLRSSAPTSPSAGDVYADDGTNTDDGTAGLRIYDGASWKSMGGTQDLSSSRTGSAAATGDDVTVEITDGNNATFQDNYEANTDNQTASEVSTDTTNFDNNLSSESDVQAALDTLDNLSTSSVAGSDTQMQYNDGGNMGGASNATYDDTSGALTLGGNPNLILSDAAADPASNGEFTLNGTDVKVFTGGGVKNLSNIGSGTGGVDAEDDGSTVVSDSTAFNFSSNLSVTDDGDGTVSVSAPSGGTDVAVDLTDNDTDDITALTRLNIANDTNSLVTLAGSNNNELLFDFSNNVPGADSADDLTAGNFEQTDFPASTDFGEVATDGSKNLILDTLTSAWDAGSYGITAETFTSDVADGTSPFNVTSTTRVDNLNADTVDGDEASAFLQDITGESFGDLSNVNTSSPGNGAIPIYDSTTDGAWESNTLTGGTNVSITNGEGSITIDSTDTDTHTSVSRSGTFVLSDVDDINFIASNDASLNVTDDTDGSVSVDVSTTVPVDSVAGKTGAVSLVKSDVGLGNVPNEDATAPANWDYGLTGADTNVITGTSGTSGNIIEWNNDGDAVDTGIASSNVVTPSSTDTFTNKTFDADGTGNSLSNVDIDDMVAGDVVLESEGIGSNDNDDGLPTAAAVKDYADTNDATGTDDQNISGSGLSNETLTIGIENGNNETVDFSSFGGGLSYSIISSNTTASAGNGYLADVSGGTLTLTLPSSPSEGDKVGVADFYSNSSTNAITVDNNGNNIEGSASNFTVNTDSASYVFAYTDSTRGWEIIHESVPNETREFSFTVPDGDYNVIIQLKIDDNQDFSSPIVDVDTSNSETGWKIFDATTPEWLNMSAVSGTGIVPSGYRGNRVAYIFSGSAIEDGTDYYCAFRIKQDSDDDGSFSDETWSDWTGDTESW